MSTCNRIGAPSGSRSRHFVDSWLGGGFDLGRRVWGRGSAGFMLDSGLRLLATLLPLGNLRAALRVCFARVWYAVCASSRQTIHNSSADSVNYIKRRVASKDSMHVCCFVADTARDLTNTASCRSDRRVTFHKAMPATFHPPGVAAASAATACSASWWLSL